MTTRPNVKPILDVASAQPKRDQPGRFSFLWPWFGSMALAVAIALGVRAVVVETFWIPSASMMPTMVVGDHIIVERLAIDRDGIQRGDLIVFTRPASLVATPSVASGPAYLTKRVVATGGSVVQAQRGTVTVDGRALAEPYVSSPTSDFGPIVVPVGHVFVMGDNRANSADSRVFGPIPTSSVVGSAFARIWPIGRIGLLH